MRQRVSFLRSLLAGKPVLALDEPFASLDAITRSEMQGWLAHVLEARPRTVVFVTHDVEEAVILGDSVVVMSRRPGRAVDRIEVPLARPRRRTDADVVALRERALEALGVPDEARDADRPAADCAGGADRGLGGIRRCRGADPTVLPPPHAIFSSLWNDRSLLWRYFHPTAEAILLGILVAALIGLSLAI